MRRLTVLAYYLRTMLTLPPVDTYHRTAVVADSMGGLIAQHALLDEQLAAAVSRPGDLSYSQLKLLPFWDPLRGDPRFEKITKDVQQPVMMK